MQTNKQPVPIDKLKQPPAEAFVLTARMQEPNDPEKYDVQLLARTPNPLFHWWWGNIVHDMAGFSKHKEKIALDWNHDPNTLVGYADKQETDETGLTLSGKLVSLEPNDQADKIRRWKSSGVPLEASIYFDEAELEYIPEEATTLVNGFQFAGPGVVVRKWTIRGCAICPYGYDGKTETRMSKHFNFSWKGTEPMQKLSEDQAVPETESDSGNAPVTETTVTETVTETTTVETETVVEESSQADTLSAARKELSRYTEVFGPAEGATYFANGLSFLEAQTDFIKKLKSSVQDLTAKIAEKDSQLAEFRKSLGEESGLETRSREGAKKFVSSMSEAREAKK